MKTAEELFSRSVGKYTTEGWIMKEKDFVRAITEHDKEIIKLIADMILMDGVVNDIPMTFKLPAKTEKVSKEEKQREIRLSINSALRYLKRYIGGEFNKNDFDVKRLASLLRRRSKI